MSGNHPPKTRWLRVILITLGVILIPSIVLFLMVAREMRESRKVQETAVRAKMKAEKKK